MMMMASCVVDSGRLPTPAYPGIPGDSVFDSFSALVHQVLSQLDEIKTDLGRFKQLCSQYLAADMLQSTVVLLHNPGKEGQSELPALMTHKATQILYTHFREEGGGLDDVTLDKFASISPLEFINRYETVFLRRCSLLQALVYCSDSDGIVKAAREINEATAKQELLTKLDLNPLENLDVATSLISWYHNFVERNPHAPVVRVVPRCVPFEIFDMPKEILMLLQRIEHEPCSNCNTIPKDPAVCLLCGRICCFGGSCCRHAGTDFGECYKHATTCCNVFMLPYNVQIYFLRSDARHPGIGPTIFFDEHGESDKSLSRGKPLFLSAENYAEIRRIIRDFVVDDMCYDRFRIGCRIEAL